MWQFAQSSGDLTTADGTVYKGGWAGHSVGRDNPADENIKDIGPIPEGLYTIGDPYENPHTGPYTMDLTPDPSNEMFGRSLFRIHGAAYKHPELSSDGCIIEPRDVREKIHNSGDNQIRVVA